MKIRMAAVLALLSLAPAATAGEKLQFHVVPTPLRSYRLLAMSMDADGQIWAGSIHRRLHRYDPRTGAVETIPVPYEATVCSCLCVGEKVYILGQAYPRLIIYDRSNGPGKFRELAYPSERPDVWYGTGPVGGRHLYLFDRGSAGVIKWDTHTDTGKAIPYPYDTPLPSGGRYEPRDGAVWCWLWDFAGGQYKPVGLARLDAASDRFTGWWKFPEDTADLRPFTEPADTFFLPHSLRGKVVPFDFKEKRWCRPLDVPGFGERFGFMGGPVGHGGRHYFSLSTYDGDDTGCDGKPYHFCNAILEFDPHARRFEFLTLEAEGAYYQIAYSLSAGGEFFATGTNIREPDGTLNRDRAGEVIFWQTRKPVPLGSEREGP